MRKTPLLVASFICLLTLNGISDSIEEATYAKLFDRAKGLAPGRTTIKQDLIKEGEWSVSGGSRVDNKDEVAVKTKSNTVEFVWKGQFPYELNSLSLEFTVTSTTPVQIMYYNFTGERFNKMGGWKSIKPDTNKTLKYRLKGKGFKGFKLMVKGEGLSGKIIGLKNIFITGLFHEGYFRHEVEIPKGKIWEAVAEVGACTTLYINGKRVDDETIILPRPMPPKGGAMYLSRRVPLKKYLKTGRNVLAMSRPRTPRAAPAVYLRGSVIMDSGKRIMLDSGMNWIWSSKAPENWYSPDFDASGWKKVLDHTKLPRTMGLSTYYKGTEAVATPISKFGLNYRSRGELPCYDGFIKLRNPLDKKFYFNENATFKLNVMLPPGFKDGKPAFTWAISQFNKNAKENNFKQVAKGKADKFKLSGDSLTSSIDAGNLPRGIYVLTGQLQVNGKTIEEREPELMVVTGKVKMKKSAGNSLEQGMKMKLEKIVDFTSPIDPHPSFETDHKGPMPGGNTLYWGTEFYHTLDQPLIVERNGLKYRTTRPVNRAQFSYRVDFAHPGDWYLLVLEYPDDAERWMGVSCSAGSRIFPLGKRPRGKRADACSKCGPTIWTGGKYPNTGKMLEMKWIYRPDPGSHAINVMSLMKKTEAAAARLRIYHIIGNLTELDTGKIPPKDQRRFGMLSERTYSWASGIYNLFSSFAEGEIPSVSRGSTGAGKRSTNIIIDACEYLYLLEDAASHYAEYMRFSGQNIHTMGLYQYSDANTASQYLTGAPRLNDSCENMLARVLQANDLRFYASVEFVSTEKLGQNQKKEWFFADRYGERPTSQWAGKPLNLNFLSPDIEKTMLELSRQLAQSFKHQSNFLGVNWTTYFQGFWLPSYRTYSYPYISGDPLGNGYDNLTVGLFEKDTGIKVPPFAEATGARPGKVDDPERFEKRYQFLTSKKMKPRWLAWRSQKMAGFFEKMNKIMRKIRPDLETVAGCYFDDFHIKEWKNQQIDFKDYLDQWGWNPEAFKNKPGIWVMPWIYTATRYRAAAKIDGYAMAWQPNHDPGFYDAFADLNKRAIMLCAGWIEVERIAANFPYRVGWPRPYQQTMLGQQREEFAMEPYSQAMNGFDPQMVMIGFTDVSPYIGVEETQRKFARVLRRLPWDKFERVLGTGFNTNFAIRAMRKDDIYNFYVVNPGYWPINGTITVEGAKKVTDMVSGNRIPVKNSAIAVKMAPYGIAAFSAIGPEAKLTAWQTEPLPKEDLEHINNIIEKANKALANPNMADFLGKADYELLKTTTAKVKKELAEQKYAAAWANLTDGFYWTVLLQKAPEIKYVEFTKKREITAVKVDKSLTPKIDGILDDQIWKEIKPEGPFVTVHKAYSEVPTFVRMAYSGNRLFIAFELPDPKPENIRGNTDKNDVNKTIWESKDDLIDFFIMPNKNRYYQFAVTSNGAQFDQENRLKHGVRTVDYDYSPKWKAATSRNKKGWTVEVELDAQDAFKEKISDGTDWGINFFRQFGLNRHPLSSWSYNPGNWHDREYLGIVKFKNKK